MVFGYARVSTENQNLASQIDAIKLFGVEEANIYCDKDSGKKTDRKGLTKLIERLREGDTVVFYDLTRIGRNFKHLITVMEYFAKHKIDFKDLTNPAIDTKSMETPAGRFIFRLFSALGELQREQSNDKVRAGLESARKQGRTGGRPPGLSKRLKDKSPFVASLYRDKTADYSMSEISSISELSPGSVYKCLRYQGIKIGANHRNRGNKNRTKNTKI